ncbi:SaoD/DsrE family protein [Thermus filiformis]|uniref:Sulfur reduction protein DsrE n=1 Tax=Thermus filiformis TaxID=276 RepID=A0A0A2X7P7_THEFI|nr:SaoD/DsrE family protein [Thermus filiformis]KGQ21219.1 sulfur reduction protein DsrE [Thermus filiformis]
MRVAYILSSPRAASHKLAQMILPQLEAGVHGAEVKAIFFFDDNVLLLQRGNPIGERLSRLAREKGIRLMVCDLCALERGLAEGEARWCTPEGEGRTSPGDCRLLTHVVDGVEAACFPDLYRALAGQVDQVITL